MPLSRKNRLIAEGAFFGGLLSKIYSGQNRELVNGYGWNLLAPSFLYNLSMTGLKTILPAQELFLAGYPR